MRLLIYICGLVIEWRQVPECVNNLLRLRCILLSHQQNRTANAGESVLDCIDRFQVRYYAGGFKQATHNYGFSLLFGVENLDEFFVGLGLGLGRNISRLWHASSIKLSAAKHLVPDYGSHSISVLRVTEVYFQG